MPAVVIIIAVVVGLILYAAWRSNARREYLFAPDCPSGDELGFTLCIQCFEQLKNKIRFAVGAPGQQDILWMLKQGFYTREACEGCADAEARANFEDRLNDVEAILERRRGEMREAK